LHCTSPSYESLERALESHDGHQEPVWEQTRGHLRLADVVLVSDEYKPDSVGWRMEQQEINGRRRSPFRR
jgi:hypothetical protein